MASKTGFLAKLALSGRNQADSPGSSPCRKIIIEKRSGILVAHWSELWEYRELLHTFVERELKIRYKQTAIGVSWVVLQPMITVLILTVIFGQLAKIPSDG